MVVLTVLVVPAAASNCSSLESGVRFSAVSVESLVDMFTDVAVDWLILTSDSAGCCMVLLLTVNAGAGSLSAALAPAIPAQDKLASKQTAKSIFLQIISPPYPNLKNPFRGFGDRHYLTLNHL